MRTSKGNDSSVKVTKQNAQFRELLLNYPEIKFIWFDQTSNTKQLTYLFSHV